MTTLWARNHVLGALAALAMAGSQAGATPIILDNFSAFQVVQQSIAGATASSTMDTPSVLGGWRTMQVQKTVPGSPHQKTTTTVDDFSGYLSFSQDSDVRSRAQLTYNGSNTGQPATVDGEPTVKNLGGVDMWNPVNALVMRAWSDNFGLPVTFTFYGTAGAKTSSVVQINSSDPYFLSTDPVTQLSLFVIPLTAFTSTGGTNESIFSAVTAFQVLFDGSNPATSAASTDVKIAYMAITAIPEPATYGLIGAALVSMSLLRKRLVR